LTRKLVQPADQPSLQRTNEAMGPWISLVLLALVSGSGLSDSPQTEEVKGVLRIRGVGRISTTELSLNAGQYHTMSRADGSFVFHDVIPGVYTLTVLSPTHMFSQVKLDVGSQGHGKIRAREYRYPGAPVVKMQYPLTLDAHVQTQYFEQRQQFGLSTFLSNPMALMMFVTMGILFIFPKMMKNMDPEQMKEMQEQMNRQQDPSKLFSELMGGGSEEAEKSSRPRKLRNSN